MAEMMCSFFIYYFVYFRIAAVLCFAFACALAIFHLSFFNFYFLSYKVLVLDTKMYEHESRI